MSIIKKSPNIAIFFGIIAISTSLILIFEMPKIINYIFAVFWLVTGLLGVYSSRKHISD
jgi:hypothetical protein